MDKKEFAKLAMAIKEIYPQANLLNTDTALSIWFKLLGDLDYGVAEASLLSWASANKWPPSIADIREGAARLTLPEIPDWSEGWEAVINAIHRWGMHRESEALATLPEIARKAVKRLGWQNICLSEEIGVERANFRQIYEAIAAREKKDAQLPPGLTASVVKRLEIQAGVGNES